MNKILLCLVLKNKINKLTKYENIKTGVVEVLVFTVLLQRRNHFHLGGFTNFGVKITQEWNLLTEVAADNRRDSRLVQIRRSGFFFRGRLRGFYWRNVEGVFQGSYPSDQLSRFRLVVRRRGFGNNRILKKKYLWISKIKGLFNFFFISMEKKGVK